MPLVNGIASAGTADAVAFPPSKLALAHEVRDDPGLSSYSPVIWTMISLFRGLLSNSANTICCHVPNSIAPFSKGITRLGPARDAYWLKPLASPQVSS